MLVINDNSVVVYSGLELKQALENDNGYINIYFGSDIVLTNGITINKNKQVITIDGQYENVRHKYEDKKSTSTSDTITASNTNTLVIVKNMDITSYNYYGIIYVAENTSFKNISVEYNNITYLGPQISFNPVGLTRFVDSTITVQDNYAAGNEVAECNRIEMGGKCVITHNSQGNSSFWFRNDSPSMTILENANITFISTYRELIYGINNLELNIKTNATFNVTVYNGLGYGNYGTGNTTISSGASFIIKQTKQNSAYATWYSYGKLLIDDASLRMINDFSSSNAANYNIYFGSANASLILNNPREIVLYNVNANIMYSAYTIPFNFEFSRINLFQKAININDLISKGTLPTFAWYKKNQISSISGTFSNSKTTVTASSFVSEDLLTLPSLDNFIFVNKRIMSIGDTTLHINSITDESTQIIGYTVSKASVLITYDEVSAVTEADENGKFIYNLASTLPIGTIITFNLKTSQDLIYKTDSVTIVYAGDITIISAPEEISFVLNPISLNPLLCPKSNDIEVKILDTRIYKTPWSLLGSLNHDLVTENGDILKESIVILNGNDISILSETPIVLFENSNEEENEISINWAKNEGILLNVKNPIMAKRTYKAKLTWQLRVNEKEDE